MTAVLPARSRSAGPAAPARADAEPTRPPTLGLALTIRALALVGVCTLGFAGYALGISAAQHHRAQALLRDQWAEVKAAGTAPAGGEIEAGLPIGSLRIPAIGVDEIVLEGTSGSQLKDGPGHRRSSPLPGQPGTSVLMGRALVFGGPFARVNTLQPGATITVVTAQGTFTYRVERLRRDGDPIPPPLAEGQSRLTLVTAEGDSELSKDRIVFADALLKSQAQPAPGNPVRVQLAAEAPLARETSALVPLVLWLQLLVLVVTGMAVALLRWGRWETWLAGVPIVAAVAVQVCQSAALALLPNLM